MVRRTFSVLFLLLCGVNAAAAQNWSFDARKVALGSLGSGRNLATKMIAEERDYRALVLPFGLIQVYRDFARLNPDNDEFDLLRTIEYAASPLHYTIGREASDSRADDFVADVSNGELSRDLNDYKGFVPVNQPLAEGLASPNWGKTFRMRQRVGGSFQGVYVGAGPYLSMRTDPIIDDRLIEILSADGQVYVPNEPIAARNATLGQLALAVTGGYRGRFAWAPGIGLGTDREGLYVAANYHYLHGFRYEDLDFQLRMDTDGDGLLTLNPLLPPPLLVTRTNASSGTGTAVDVGVGAVVDRWELGFGANGIGNRIEWTEVERTTYFHQDLLNGSGDLIESAPLSVGDVRVELPVDYRANVGYTLDRWGGVAEFGSGFQGKSFHGGVEYRLDAIELRGGATYSRELWNPAAGIGFSMGSRTALDVAVYGNSANVERERRPAIAMSLRFNR